MGSIQKKPQLAPAGFFQKNGWMDDSLGERWFNDVFLQFCGSERPQLLILDGNSSHESVAILMRAIEEGIHILALPPHTTHYLQPFDRAVFGPLNRTYNDLCSKFLQESPLNQINKWTFPALFRKAWDKSVTSVNIKSGFKACGIIPLNREAIPESAFAPSDPSDCPIAVGNPSDDATNAISDNSDHVILTAHETSASSTNQVTDDHEAQDVTDQIRPNPVIDSHVEMDPVLSELKALAVEQPLVADATSKANKIIHELDLSGASDILDISDPSQLFQLIGGGDYVVELVTDSVGNEIVLACTSDTTPVCEPAIKKLKAESNPSDMKTTIESVFIPQATGDVTKRKQERKQPRKSITSHRLLTSRDIINEKLYNRNRKKSKK